ncbi:MAG: carbamoyltransferase, partial [Patescibacteria group bacterium]
LVVKTQKECIKNKVIILGISCFYHDAAACILKDGEIIAAAAEERFSRKKHDNNFPKKAIEFCLNYLRIAANEVDVVAFYEKPIIKFERVIDQHLQHFPISYKTFIESMDSWMIKKLQMRKLLSDEFSYHGKIQYILHHVSHAASAFYLSNFKKSAIVTIDGVGEWATTTIGVGQGKKIKIDKEIRFPHSLGLFYSTITAYLGFRVNNSEYKVMGLAAYGDPKRFMSKSNELVSIYKDGSYALNMKYFDYTWSSHMPSKRMEELFGYSIRKHGERLYKHHKDIAASAQLKLEETIFNLLNITSKSYKTENLCLAGGVVLNSVMNGKIIDNTPFKNVFIPPDPGDGGGAMGAALYVHFKHSNKNRRKDFTPFLGPEYTWYEIQHVLNKYKLDYILYSDTDKLLGKVSDLLIKQKVIGWFQGRMEWGPRALGARSILASAAKEEMRDIINKKVKKREMFRPFAPVVLEEYVDDYFEAKDQPRALGKYMLTVLPFKEKGRKEAPATVHVDGTGRLQSIGRDGNPLYYDLIEQYMKKTGTPILVNTSFNVKGEPIVCTPEEAVNCFLRTEIDFLVIDDFVVTKK